MPLPDASPPLSLLPVATASKPPLSTRKSPTPLRDIPLNERRPKPEAWKQEGLQAFREWAASKDDYFVFRRFESLNVSTIQWMQDRICRLENRLEEIYKQMPDAAFSLESTQDDHAKRMQERDKIMDELSSLLLRYDQYIEAFAKIRARPRAKQYQLDKVKSWLRQDAKDGPCLTHANDFITIEPRSRPPLDWMLAIFISLLSRGSSRAKAFPRDTEDSRFTATVTITYCGLAMLLTPIWWMYNVSSYNLRLGIITGFLCLFIFIMTVSTVSKSFEVIAAAAAYAAVLIVFLQIDSSK